MRDEFAIPVLIAIILAIFVLGFWQGVDYAKANETPCVVKAPSTTWIPCVETGRGKHADSTILWVEVACDGGSR